MAVYSRQDLLHPDLRDKSKTYLVLRSSVFSRYFYPESERISWRGGAIRPGGGQGMYMTFPQALMWPNWIHSDDIRVGPF